MNEWRFFIEQAQKDLLSFCVFTDYNFDIIAHHELIAENLQKLMDWDIQNLIISMPPRAWKSRIMQEFICYLLWKQAWTDILYTWHTKSILEDFSYNIRWRMRSKEYKSIFDTRIAQDSSAVSSWKTNNGSNFSIYWVGWGITGKWGHYMIIDDPYATRQDAESDTIRRTVSNWYWSTFLSRKQSDKAKQIIIMQRWREDDLVWEILETEADKWVELKIPALNDKDESFWADKFSKEYFMDIREKNPLFFSSQYQQEPFNEWGWDFLKEYFEYYEFDELEEKLHEMQIYTFVDPAISQKQEADNTAIVTVWMYNNYIYLLDVKKMKEKPDEIIEQIFITVNMYRDLGKSYRLGIENVQYQKMLILEVQKQMRIRDIFFNLEEVRPTGEKEARIRTALQGRYSGHTIIHPKYWPNIKELESELLKFPNGKHDDMIDALASSVAMTATVSNKKPKKIIKRSLQGFT